MPPFENVPVNLDQTEKNPFTSVSFIIDPENIEILVEYLSQKKDLSIIEALKLVNAGRIDLVVRFLPNFKNLPVSIAFGIIEAGEGSEVIFNLRSFNVAEESAIVLKLIEKGYAEHIKYTIGGFGKFKSLSNEVASKLIELNHIHSVAFHLSSFRDLSSENLDKVNLVLEKNKNYVLGLVKSNSQMDDEFVPTDEQ